MFKLYSTNLVDQSVITPSSENALFPSTNLKHPFRSKVFRSTSSADSVVFDLGETSEINSLILVDVPRDGFGITSVTLELNATSDFSSPAFSISPDINVKHGIASVSFDTESYRFARLVLTSALGYCELSKVFIGKSIEFENNMGVNLGWTYRDDEQSTSRENEYGQIFTDVKSRRRFFTFGISSMTKEELEQVFELYDGKGETKPFFFELGTTEMSVEPERYSGMYYLTTVPTITNKSFGLYDISLSLKEAM